MFILVYNQVQSIKGLSHDVKNVPVVKVISTRPSSYADLTHKTRHYNESDRKQHCNTQKRVAIISMVIANIRRTQVVAATLRTRLVPNHH